MFLARRLRPAIAMVVLFALASLTLLSTRGAFSDSSDNAGNLTAAESLDPPTGLSATGGASADLSWTATADTYASGYRVLRGTASGGPYTQIAEVTPRATTTYTDSPADGTYYYVLRSFFQSWESVNSNEASATVSGCTVGDTGFQNPSASAADTGGDNDGFEVSPSLAFADGGGVAENQNGAGDRHRFSNYGLSIPAGCSINGIEVQLDWWVNTAGGTNSISAELSWDGGASWTAAQTDTTETTVEHTFVLGGAADTWGRTWSISELSDANFRVRLTANSSAAGRDFFLDWIPVKVTYAP